MEDLELILTAAKEVEKSYTGFQHKRLSTEWMVSEIFHKGKRVQVLSIPGTKSDFSTVKKFFASSVDWLWNVVLTSRKGVKSEAYHSGNRIMKEFVRHGDMPLLVTGHSQGGPTALYVGRELKADYIVSFCPAPGFRKREKIDNAVIVIDPDDIVHDLGKVSFKHPNVPILYLNNNHRGRHVKDHDISHVVEELSTMV